MHTEDTAAREAIARALQRKWEEEGAADEGTEHEITPWEELAEQDRESWRAWADTALGAVA